MFDIIQSYFDTIFAVAQGIFPGNVAVSIQVGQLFGWK